MDNGELLQLQDFIFGWGHGQARVYIGDAFFDCEFRLPKEATRPNFVTAIEVFTNVLIVSGYLIGKTSHDHRVPQRIGLGSIRRIEATDGGEPLIWQSKDFKRKNA